MIAGGSTQAVLQLDARALLDRSLKTDDLAKARKLRAIRILRRGRRFSK